MLYCYGSRMLNLKIFLINGLLLQTKADELARMCSDFKCSDGWLSGFKSRNNITYQTVHGQSSDVKKDVCTNFGRKLLGLFFTYLPKDIFKVGKTAIFFFFFYKLLPNKTLHFKEDACIGGKSSK